VKTHTPYQVINEIEPLKTVGAKMIQNGVLAANMNGPNGQDMQKMVRKANGMDTTNKERSDPLLNNARSTTEAPCTSHSPYLAFDSKATSLELHTQVLQGDLQDHAVANQQSHHITRRKETVMAPTFTSKRRPGWKA